MSSSHGWKKRNGGDGLLNDLIDANIGGDNQDESTHVSSSHGWKKRNGGDGILNGTLQIICTLYKQ